MVLLTTFGILRLEEAIVSNGITSIFHPLTEMDSMDFWLAGASTKMRGDTFARPMAGMMA
jgi:hypothetical protein